MTQLSLPWPAIRLRIYIGLLSGCWQVVDQDTGELVYVSDWLAPHSQRYSDWDYSYV